LTAPLEHTLALTAPLDDNTPWLWQLHLHCLQRHALRQGKQPHVETMVCTLTRRLSHLTLLGFLNCLTVASISFVAPIWCCCCNCRQNPQEWVVQSADRQLLWQPKSRPRAISKQDTMFQWSVGLLLATSQLAPLLDPAITFSANTSNSIQGKTIPKTGHASLC